MAYRVFRILRAASRAFPLLVLFLYLGLFVFTFPLVFVFPPGPLLMVFVGLAGLPIAVIAGRALRALEHALARGLLRSGVCPGCAGRRPFAAPQGAGEPPRCEECGAIFLKNGIEQEMAAPIGSAP